MRIIKSNRGVPIKVDNGDYTKLSKYSWRISPLGYVHTGHGRSKKMHQIIFNIPKGMEADHINRNKLDNRKSNLRICNHQQNSFNKAPWSKTGYKGIYKHIANGKYVYYRSRLMLNGKRFGGKYFKTPEEAAKDYNLLARKYYGEFAYINPVL